MLTEEEIEQIVNNPSCRLKAWERDSASNFLRHIRDVIIPIEKEELKHGVVTSFEMTLDMVVQNPFWLDMLLGDFWERQFCCLVSHWGYHTFRTQKYKVTGGGRLGIGDPKIDPRKDIKLPDILFTGEGRMGWCDVKHNSPRMAYPDFGVFLPVAIDWLKLLSYQPHLAIYYIFHSYLPLDKVGYGEEEWKHYWYDLHSHEYNRADKWSTENREEDWIGIKIIANTPVDDYTLQDLVADDGKDTGYFRLRDFIPLRQLLQSADNRLAPHLSPTPA